MKFLASIIGFILICSSALGNPGSRQLRYLSFMIRDQPPSVQESKDFKNGAKNIDEFVAEWIENPRFQVRLTRFFNDWFGIGEEVELLEFNHYLTLNASGALYQPNKGDCDSASTVQTAAWWLEAGQTVAVCSNMVSSQVVYNAEGEEELYCPGGGSQGILHAECGCGPEMILCLPESHKRDQAEALRREFRDRAVYSFNNQLPWSELLGGDFFYGTRYLYQMYLLTSDIGVVPRNPTAEEIQVLYSLSLLSPGRKSFPSSENLRAGAVTAPAFLQQFNNFRSRIRALSNTLLCTDIDGSLNTSGISTFLNPDLSDFDRQHGDDEGCASCHYPMDNLGSMLLGWGPNGYFQHWKNLSQTGHAFGQNGSGPRDLMMGFVERGPGFLDCMGKKSWEDFTGEPWSTVKDSVKPGIMEAAIHGPYSLITHIINLDSTHKNRYVSSIETVLSTEKPQFNTVNSILIESCAGSSCHSSGTALGTQYEYVDNESNFQSASASRLSSQSMPPPGSDKTLSDENRSVLIRFLKD